MQFAGQTNKEKAAINDRILSQLRSQAEKQKMNKEQAQQLYDRLVQAQAKREASVGMMRVQSILKDSKPDLSKSPSQAKRVGLLHKDLSDRTTEIIENRKSRIQEMKFLRNQIQEERNKEECTFTPKINSYSIKRSTSRKSQNGNLRQSTPDLASMNRHSLGLSPKGLKSPSKKPTPSPTCVSHQLRASTGAFSSNLSSSAVFSHTTASPMRRPVPKHPSAVLPSSSLTGSSTTGTCRTGNNNNNKVSNKTHTPTEGGDSREVISVSQLCRNFELMGVHPPTKKTGAAAAGAGTGAYADGPAERKHSISMKKARVQCIVENSQTKPPAAKINERKPPQPVEKPVGTPRLEGRPLQDPDFDKENRYQQSNRGTDRSPVVGKNIESPLTFAKSSRLNVTFEGTESVCSSPVFCKPQPTAHPKNNPFYETFQAKPNTGNPSGKRAAPGRQALDQFFP